MAIPPANFAEVIKQGSVPATHPQGPVDSMLLLHQRAWPWGALENAERSQPFIPGTGLEAEAGVLQIQSYGNYSMSLRIPAQLSKTVANRR